MRIIVVTLSLCLVCAVSFAADQDLEDKLKTIYQKAEQAIQEDRIEESDFWLARYMGLTAFNEKTERNYTDLYPLFQKRQDLVPVSFISSEYADDFIDFFIRGTLMFWGIPDEGINENDLEFAILGTSEEDYFAEVVISPRLESWYIMKKPYATAIIPLISYSKKPFIVSGLLKEGKPEKFFDKHYIDTDGKLLHYIWPIEFYDLDDDDVPEILVRYNVAWADGFSQRLDIYKIEDNKKLVLVKRFEGKAEGITRRLKNGLIEVGEGFTNEGATRGHLGYDKTRMQTFEYKDGDFVKISEEEIPHILWNEDWTKYYFEN